MIDPIFSKRLQNWSRCIRARRKSLPSPTAQVLNELRLKYGPPAIEEYRNEPPISSADMADAEKLSICCLWGTLANSTGKARASNGLWRREARRFVR